jgi:hypothetical protein
MAQAPEGQISAEVQQFIARESQVAQVQQVKCSRHSLEIVVFSLNIENI